MTQNFLAADLLRALHLVIDAAWLRVRTDLLAVLKEAVRAMPERPAAAPAKTEAIYTPDLPPLAAMLSSAQVAQMLGVSARTLWRMVSTGAAPAPIRFNRKHVKWQRHVVEDFIKADVQARKTA